MKSERLKKLESELQDLEQWLNLGLVPNKDIDKHKHEIEIMKNRVDDEKKRLLAIKENGDLEEFSVPKRFFWSWAATGCRYGPRDSRISDIWRLSQP